MRKQIKNIVGYQVDEFGNIYSSKSNKIMKQRKAKNGYMRVNLYYNGKKHNCSVHRLVFETFYRCLQPNEAVHHCDKNKQNNAVTNLVAIDKGLHSSRHNSQRIPPMLGKHFSQYTKKLMSLKALQRTDRVKDEKTGKFIKTINIIENS